MAENKVVNLEVKEKGMEEMGQKTLSLKAKLKELKDQMALAGDGTAEFKKLAAEAGALQDRIADVNRQVKNLSSDTRRLDLGLEAVQGVAGGFAAAQGAMSLFGDESEEMQKRMMKVMGAVSLVNGVQQVANVLNKDAVLGTKLRVFWNETLVGSFKKATVAQKAFMATGIGLLLTGVATLVAYWDDIAATIGGVSDEQTKLNAKTDANVLAQQAKYDAISGQDNILKLQGKSERDILKIKQTQIQAVIKATEAQLVQQESTKKAQVAAAKRNRDILQGIIRFITAPLTLLLGTIDMVGKALGKDFGLEKSFSGGIAKMVFDPKEVAEKADKTIDETKKQLSKLKNEAAGFTLALKKIDKPAEKVVKDSGKKAVEEAKKEVEVMETLKTNSLKSGVSTLLKTRQEELLIEKQASDDKIALKEQELEALAIIADAENKIRDANISNIAAGIDLVKNLFANNKKIQAAALIAESAVAIARTIISTKAANQAARAQGTAASIITGGASVIAAEALVLRNNIGAGISIAAQIAATAKGVSALGGGGTPPSNDNSSDGGGGGSFSPNFNVVGNSGVNQLAQLQQQPVQAYVVSGSVTTAQSLDRNRIENATL
jgi:hypothetical protein